MPDSLVTDESAQTRIYNEITLRYEKIQHVSGPTLNKIATSTWFNQTWVRDGRGMMINCEQPLLARADVFGNKPGPDFDQQHFALAVTQRVSHLFNIRKNSTAVMPGLGLRETMTRLQDAQEMGRRVALREVEAQVCNFDTRVEKANAKVATGKH